MDQWFFSFIGFIAPHILTFRPDIAALWETDPFFQLIDKGAKVDSDLLKVIALFATDSNCTEEDRTIHASRAKKLLQLGLERPSTLSRKERAWITQVM